MTLLSRYLLKEILLPLCAWVAFLFALLFVMSFLRGTEVLLGSGVTPVDLVKFALFLAPHFLQQAIPIAFLLAILLGIGRLAEDLELTALQSLGRSPWQILAGPLSLGLVLGGAMFLLASTAEPWGLRAVEGAANEIIKRNLAGDVKPGQFYENLSNLVLYAEQVNARERTWRNVLVHDDRDSSKPILVLARDGRVHASGQGENIKLSLADGRVHRADRSSSDYALLGFEGMDIAIGVGESFFRKNRFRSPKEQLSPAELLQAAASARDRGEDPRPFLATFHWRIGQAAMPIAFALLGTPLAMARRRSGRARGYVLTLGGYVAYYVLARVCVSLGERGKVPLWLAGQVPNLVFIGVGLVLLLHLSRGGDAR